MQHKQKEAERRSHQVQFHLRAPLRLRTQLHLRTQLLLQALRLGAGFGLLTNDQRSILRVRAQDNVVLHLEFPALFFFLLEDLLIFVWVNMLVKD